MNIKPSGILATCLLACLFVYPTVLSAQDTPSITLFTFHGDRSTSQAATDPLLLYVVINNSAATRIERDNQRNQQIIAQYKLTDSYKNLSKIEQMEVSEQYPVREIPTFTLGSDQASVESLISFLVRDDQGNNIDLAIRMLEANDHQPRAIDLLEERSLYYQFAVESDQLAQLPPGSYHFVASVDTTQHADMWNGWIYSRSVAIALSDTHPEPGWDTSNQRMLLQSTFLVEDHQFKKAEDHASLWIEQHSGSINAWSQLGEALYGLGRNEEALEAFNTAIDRFRSKHGDTPVEPPQEILDRISEIEES